MKTLTFFNVPKLPRLVTYIVNYIVHQTIMIYLIVITKLINLIEFI